MNDTNNFIRELADLLEKYKIQVELVEASGYNSTVVGVDFVAYSIYDKNCNITRPFSNAEVRFYEFNPEGLRNLAK
jgi:hypothetical protein